MRSIQLTTLVLACAWTASAQDRLPPKTTTEPITKATVLEDKHFLHKASDVLGADVKDPKSREEIGEVKDLVINRDGGIDYAVVSLDAGLGTGDKRFVVPWTVFMPTAGEDPDDCFLAITIDRERLRNAPSFDEDRWPDLAMADWSRSVDEFYRDDTRAREASAGGMDPVARPAGMSRGPALRVSQLKGCNVTTSSGEKAGEIEELGIDNKHGRVALVVLASGGFLGLGEDRHALPWPAFSFAREGDGDDDEKLACRLNIPESKLENAPKYDRSDWNRISEPAYLEKTYTHFGYPTYWKSEVRRDASGRSDELEEGKEKKEDKDGRG